MVELIGKIDRVASEIQKLSIDEIEDEKSISTSKIIERQFDNLEIEKTANSDNIIRCEYIFARPYKRFTQGIKGKKGDQCPNKPVSKPGNRYCCSHKWTPQAKKARELKKNIPRPYKEYYCDPAKELTLLYGDVYTDTTNMIVQKNPDSLSDIKWIVICRSKVDQLGNRILHKLTQNFINKLNDEREMYNYNFMIKPELFRQAVRDYSDSQAIHNPQNHIIDKLHKEYINIFHKGVLHNSYNKLFYKLEVSRYNIPYIELINESEYEEWFG